MDFLWYYCLILQILVVSFSEFFILQHISSSSYLCKLTIVFQLKSYAKTVTLIEREEHFMYSSPFAWPINRTFNIPSLLFSESWCEWWPVICGNMETRDRKNMESNIFFLVRKKPEKPHLGKSSNLIGMLPFTRIRNCKEHVWLEICYEVSSKICPHIW